MGKSSGGSSASGATATGYAVDTSKMEAAFAAGAEEVRREYPRALEQFQNFAELGLSNYLKLQNQANNVLVPYSDTAKAAVADLRYFLGLAPLSPTAGTASALRAAAQQGFVGDGMLRAAPAATAMIELADRMDESEAATDPAKRAALYAGVKEEQQNILNAITYAKQHIDTTVSNEEQQRRMNALESLRAEGTLSFDKYLAEFTPEKEVAATGQEIQDKLEELPEYQFKLQQGTQAMERSQAARGTLQSGGALIEAQEFGQGLAESAYATHITQLAGLLGQTMPAAAQTSQNLINTANTVLQTNYNTGATRQKSIEDQAKLQMDHSQKLGANLNQAAIATAGNLTNASIATANNMSGASIANANNSTQTGISNASNMMQTLSGAGKLAGALFL